jgi:hypothetical protein
LDEGDVEGRNALAQERGNLEGVGGGVVGASLRERLLDAGAEVEGVGVEVPVVSGVTPGRVAEGEEMEEFDVDELAVLGEQESTSAAGTAA